MTRKKKKSPVAQLTVNIRGNNTGNNTGNEA